MTQTSDFDEKALDGMFLKAAQYSIRKNCNALVG